MKTTVFRRRARGALWGLVPALVLFALLAALVLRGLDNAAAQSRSAELALARDSIRRAAVTCYALEGRYPESYAYLRDHYGLAVDEDRFVIDYVVFAENMMPEITVLPMAEAAD